MAGVVNNMVAITGAQIESDGGYAIQRARVYMVTIAAIQADTELCFDYNTVWPELVSGKAPRKLMAGRYFAANTILGWYEGNGTGPDTHAFKLPLPTGIIRGAATPKDVTRPNMIFSMANTAKYKYRESGR